MQKFSLYSVSQKRKAKISRKNAQSSRKKKQMQNFRENEMRKFCVNKYGREIIHYDTIKLLMKSSQSREFNKFFFTQASVSNKTSGFREI